MTNLKEKIINALGKDNIVGALMGLALFAPLVTSAVYNDIKAKEQTRVHNQWVENMQKLQERDCTSAYHYGNMHGHDTNGLGWAETRCPYSDYF